MKEPHRSAGKIAQRFDHPPPPAPQWTYSRVKIILALQSRWRSRIDLAISLAVTQCPQWVCAVQRRRFPVGASPTRQPLQPEAIGAVMEVTKWLKPSISVSQIGDSASVQAATRVSAPGDWQGVCGESPLR